MSDAPERIWAHCEPDDDGGTYIEYLSDEPWPGEDVGVEYIRADLAPTRSQIEALVKPLEWLDRQCNDGLVNYRIHIGYGLLNGVFALTCNGSTIGEFRSEDDAKAAAQADYTRRILAALNLQEGK